MLKLDDTDDSEEEFTCKYRDGVTYAVTIKPDDKLQFVNIETASARIFEFYKFYTEKFKRICDPKHFTYNFRIEVSEPIGNDVCTNPRLHLHGTITLRTRYSVLSWLLTVMPDLLIHARLQIVELKGDGKAWNTYMMKQARWIPKNIAQISSGVFETGDPLGTRCASEGT